MVEELTALSAEHKAWSLADAVVSGDAQSATSLYLSLRSQGKPKMAQEHIDVNVPSELQGKFHLRDGLLVVPVVDR